MGAVMHGLHFGWQHGMPRSSGGPRTNIFKHFASNSLSYHSFSRVPGNRLAATTLEGDNRHKFAGVVAGVLAGDTGDFYECNCAVRLAAPPDQARLSVSVTGPADGQRRAAAAAAAELAYHTHLRMQCAVPLLPSISCSSASHITTPSLTSLPPDC